MFIKFKMLCSMFIKFKMLCSVFILFQMLSSVFIKFKMLFLFLQEDLELSVQNMLNAFGTSRYIANLGHGIYPSMEPSSVETYVNTVHSYSASLINN